MFLYNVCSPPPLDGAALIDECRLDYLDTNISLQDEEEESLNGLSGGGSDSNQSFSFVDF